MEEKDMYPIVEEYVKNKLKDLGFELNIFSGNASSADLSLPLYGSYIKPDVYAIGEDKNGLFRIFMGEGKLTYTGRDLDGVIWQGISDQRFSHYVYLFFPKEKLDSNPEAKEFIKNECKKHGLGLLLVDLKTKKCDEIISPKISPFSIDENTTIDFEKNIIISRDKIRMNFGISKELENVHLSTMRDLAIILSTQEKWEEADLFGKGGKIEGLLKKYQNMERQNKKSSIKKYDPKIWKPIINGNDIKKFKEIMNRNLKTLLFFDIISIHNGIIEIKPLCKVMASLDESNIYRAVCGKEIRQFLTILLLTHKETRKLVEPLYKVLKENPNLPVWARKKFCPQSNRCKNKKCAFNEGWSPEGQIFPDYLEYDLKTKKHKCEINGKPFYFDNPTVTSILYCTYNIRLPERIKILLSESTLINQRGKIHEWSLAI